jgi:hypothetical protein
MKIIIHPVVDPRREIDLTNRLVAAIAEELWRLYGGNERLNWLEAERHLERIVGEAQREAAQTVVVAVAPAAPVQVDGQREPAACPACPRRAPREGKGRTLSWTRSRGFAGVQREPAVVVGV